MSMRDFIKSKGLTKEYREFAILKEKKFRHECYNKRKAKLIKQIANQ